MPMRSWRKKTGPRLVSLMSKAMNGKNGRKMMMPIRERIMSISLFRMIYLSELATDTHRLTQTCVLGVDIVDPQIAQITWIKKR